MGYEANKPAFAGSFQSAQADLVSPIAHDFNRGTGVETHRGTYTYDGAGRLIQVVDAATNTTEAYVWNADGTLASFPGPGYVRLLEYDEEGRLIRIRRDYGGGNVQLAYEYAYGFDGGRRWRKDYINGVWTRYPCGVACGAGDLVEQQKPLDGGSWTTSALYLQGISLVRRNNEWHHFDPLGTAGVITNNSATVISNSLYDLFGVKRYEQGSAETPWRWSWIQAGEEEVRMSSKGEVYLPERMVIPLSSLFHPADCPFREGGPYPRSLCEQFNDGCRKDARQRRDECKNRQAAFCDTLSFLCAGTKRWVIPFCLFFNLLCNHDETCDKRYDEWLDFCNACYQVCLHNSEPDDIYKKRFKGIPPQLLQAWGVKL